MHLVINVVNPVYDQVDGGYVVSSEALGTAVEMASNFRPSRVGQHGQ